MDYKNPWIVSLIVVVSLYAFHYWKIKSEKKEERKKWPVYPLLVGVIVYFLMVQGKGTCCKPVLQLENSTAQMQGFPIKLPPTPDIFLDIGNF
jgi:hypothetical protein